MYNLKIFQSMLLFCTELCVHSSSSWEPAVGPTPVPSHFPLLACWPPATDPA